MTEPNHDTQATSSEPANNSTAPAAPQPDTWITGSRLQEQAETSRQAKTKKYLLVAVPLAVCLVSLLLYLSFKPAPKNNDRAADRADTTQSNTRQQKQQTDEPEPKPVATVPALEDITYANGEGRQYEVKYLSGAKIIGHCEVGVYRQRCPSSPPNLRYLSAASDDRQALLFTIRKDDGRTFGGDCDQIVATVTLNNTPTEICKAELAGRAIYYAFTFTIKGERQVGTFIMDNQPGKPAYDASVYEKEIKDIVPSIRVYL